MKLPKLPGETISPKAPSAVDDEMELPGENVSANTPSAVDDEMDSSFDLDKRHACCHCHLLLVLKTWAHRIDWPLCSNLMFLVAALSYVILGLIDIIYGTKVATRELVNMTYMDANNERHFSVKRRFRAASDAQLVIYSRPGSLYNMLSVFACVLYILNPIFDFLGILVDPPVVKKSIGAAEQDAEDLLTLTPKDKDEVHFGVDETSDRYEDPQQKPCCESVVESLEQIWWDFWCPLWFLGASLIYITMAVGDIKDNIDAQTYFILDIWASHLFVADAVCGVLYWWVCRQRNDGTSVSVLFCTKDTALREVDWTGWGDLLFLAGAAVDALNCYLYQRDVVWGNYLNLFTSLLWAIDCVLYFISYKLEKRSILVATEEDFPPSPHSDLSAEDTDSF